MNSVFFFLEEESCRIVIEGLISKLNLDRRYQFTYLTFQGKRDLEKKLLPRLRGIRVPDCRIFVLRDQDLEDCQAVKQRLRRKCEDGGHDGAVVRIVCRELESWFLGDAPAVEAAFEVRNLANRRNEAALRDPDSIVDAKAIMKEITNQRYQPIGGSREIVRHLSLSENRSKSFMTLLKSLKEL